MSNEEREQAGRFKFSALGHPCVVCGAWGRGFFVQAHHVVYEQHLEGDRRFDQRNALPVCRPCHDRHHSTRRIPLSALTEANWTFAREVLGEAAEDYLRARYRPEED